MIGALLGASGAAVAVLGGLLWIQTGRLDTCSGNLEKSVENETKLATANESNLVVIDEIKAQALVHIARAEALELVDIELRAQRAVMERALADSAQQADVDVEEIRNANQECNNLGMQPICPMLSERLRDHACGPESCLDDNR